MDADWITSPSARRILALWADPRPAWLWRGDGGRLLWRNASARAEAEATGNGGPVPIKGQVGRLIRLGIVGRPSLSNLPVIAAGKPSALTCQCTPLPLEGGAPGLLIVAMEAVADVRVAGPAGDALGEALFPPGTRYFVTDADGAAIGGDRQLHDAAYPLPGLATGQPATVSVGGTPVRVTRLLAGPGGENLWLFQPGEAGAPAPEIEPVPESQPAEAEQQAAPGASAEPAAPLPPAEDEEPRDRSLSTLFDRLAEDAELYRSLDDAPPFVEVEAPESELDEDFEAAGAPAESLPPEAAAPAPPSPPKLSDGLYRVTGRGFEPLAEADSGGAPERGIPPTGGLDRVSRYNFDELSRILTDRIGGDAAARQPPPVPEAPSPETTASESAEVPEAEPPRAPESPRAEPPRAAPGPSAPPRGSVLAQSQPEGQLVSLSGEAFILNRLPLGILVFRDQTVLFANRSITEMAGFNSVEELRAAGLASIFPTAGTDAPEAGPVNHLMQRDGTLVPVTARLQSISWQGRPALMLSASATEVRTGHEAAVRAFAELVAEHRREGFIETGRNGVIAQASAMARKLLERGDEALAGKPLSELVDAADVGALRTFLERPARFAETARPAIVLRGAAPASELLVFAQGQAGIVSGYFALVRRRGEPPTPALPRPGEEDTAVLARLSRGVRRPLNSIIGFADLIRTAAFGSVGNERYAQYADDIRTAGEEIATLVEELDDYARLREGRYETRPAPIHLAVLLDSCVLRVRAQAGAARVLVRSAVSERLPRVRADRASLGQAVLNLLASAIDQTPPGGSVILSAQHGEDGTIAINVRDSAARAADPGERFVVFRDGVGRDGRALLPMRSSVGLALTQSLAEVNDCSLSVEPLREGTLFSLLIPAENVEPALALT